MANIVQKNGQLSSGSFFLSDLMAFCAQFGYCFLHQVHSTHRMMEPGVQCPRIYKVRKAQLFDAAQPLKIWMLDDIEDQFIVHRDKTIYRIVEYFSFDGHRLLINVKIS